MHTRLRAPPPPTPTHMHTAHMHPDPHPTNKHATHLLEVVPAQHGRGPLVLRGVPRLDDVGGGVARVGDPGDEGDKHCGGWWV